jgi:hypothetical protein
MTATILTNTKPRKQLADQLDRLDMQIERHDAILDALSEGLNGAVADAARDGTRLAVKDAVIELLTDPQLRAALHRASAPAAAAQPSVWARLRQRARSLAAKAKALGHMAGSAVAARVRSVQRRLTTATGDIRHRLRTKRLLLAGLGIVTAVAMARYQTRFGLAAAVSGFGAALAAVVVHAGHGLHQLRVRMTGA